MKCLFIPDNCFNDTSISVSGSDIHHILRSFRLKIGEKLELKDSIFAYTGVTKEITDSAVLFTVLEKRKIKSPNLNITLCQGILKNDSFRVVLQKATELGVSNIVPYMSDRTVVHINRSEEEKKLSRWRKICEEAAKQSGRDQIPSVSPILHNLAMLNTGSENRLLANELENNLSLKKRLLDVSADKEITILIGPEGSFTEREIRLAHDLGFHSCRLNDYILRSETAALSMISNIFFHFAC